MFNKNDFYLKEKNIYNKREMSNNILNEPVPNINVPILKPTKYIKEKKKKTKGNNIKQKIIKIFDQFRKKRGRPKKMKEGWLGWLKNSILDMFNKPQQPDFKLVLEKSALNKSTAKYVINETEGYDPITFLNMVKETILDKIRENPNSKVRVNLPCTMV